MYPRIILTLICVPLLLTATVPSDAAVMYRFTNAKGEPVYSDTLPPAQARAGYQKIDSETGQVLESVAPQLPPEKLAEKLRREQALKECRDELDRIYQLYSSESDIEHARGEALSSLENRVKQLQANLRQAGREQGRLRSQAADAERAGREIPAALLQNIQRSRSQIATLKDEIEQRHREQQRAEARYARDLERYRDGSCQGALAAAHARG